MTDATHLPAAPGEPSNNAELAHEPVHPRQAIRTSTVLLSIGLIFMAAATWGAWVAHASPGLTLLGLDLAEYVKFLPAVRSGQLVLTREVFYLPLVVLGVGLSLLAQVSLDQLPRWLCTGLALLTIPCALALLPPAWSLATFSQAEYRLQIVALALMLLWSAFTLLTVWRHKPATPPAAWQRVFSGVVFLVGSVAAIAPLVAWQQIQPAIVLIYNHPVNLGWGGSALVIGAVYLALGGMLLVSRR